MFGTEWHKPLYCKAHKQPGMKNVRNRACSVDGCEKHPSFGEEGGSARFCGEHALPGMRDVVHPRCEVQGCNDRAYFGLPGSKPTRCSDRAHHEEGMLRIVHRTCQETKACRAAPLYGGDDVAMRCEEPQVRH